MTCSLSLEEIFQFNKNDGLREFSQAQSYIAKEITVREITSRPESQQLTLEELSTPSLESREAAPLILPQAAPLTVNVIKDQGDIHDRLRYDQVFQYKSDTGYVSKRVRMISDQLFVFRGIDR